ncbi:MAG: UMP kinase [Bacteroidales bacterium]|nr:UMP kinase [Bacteroidales bacterium]
MKYNKVLLKLSGEALMGDKQQHGIDENRLADYIADIKEIVDLGVKIGIVIGGGNIFRGVSGTKVGIDRVRGDYMGMLATVINGLAIQSALETAGIKARLLTSITMEPVSERYSKKRTLDALNNNEVVIFTFGTGNPFFTTDTTAALRGVEMEAEVILKGTRVDGVYTADPEKDKTAVKYITLTFDEAYNKGLKIMDLTAFTMCRENNLPIVVFDMNKKGNLLKVVKGESIGTLITNKS